MTYNVNFSPTRYLKCTNATRLKICLTTDNTLNTFYYHIAIAFVIFFSCKETLCTPCISFSFLIPLKKLMFILSSLVIIFFFVFILWNLKIRIKSWDKKFFFFPAGGCDPLSSNTSRGASLGTSAGTMATLLVTLLWSTVCWDLFLTRWLLCWKKFPSFL